MTKEIIDKIFETGFVNSILDILEEKLNSNKFYSYLEKGDFCNLFYLIYSLLDYDLKKYFYYRCIENGLEEYTILFDNELKNEVCSEIIGNIDVKDSNNLVIAENINAIKIRKILKQTDDKRKEMLNDMKDKDKAFGISSLPSDYEKIELLENIKEPNHIFLVIASLNDDNLKINFIESFDFSDLTFIFDSFYVMISSIKNENKRYQIIATLIKNGVGNVNGYATTLISFNNDDFVKNIINNFDFKEIDEIRSQNIIENKIIFSDLDLILRKYFDREEDFSFAKNKFIQLSNKDDAYMSKVNIKLLKKDIFEIFDEKYLDEIFLYPDIQEKLLAISSDIKKMTIISDFLDRFIAEYGNARWNVFFEKIIDRIINEEYKKIIELTSLKDSNNLDILYNLLKQDNDFCIETEDDLINYNTIKKDICDKLMYNEPLNPIYKKLSNLSVLEKKQYALLQKLYGIDLLEAKRLLTFYGTDIDNLKSNNYKTVVCKKFIKTLSYIINETDLSVLDNLYNMNIKLSEADINSIMIEQELQCAYMREYNNVLFDPKKDGEIIKKEGEITFVDAGVEFNILMTSVAAYYMKKIDNYKDSWDNTFDFCGSFIRNDMLGTAQIPNVCFGFSSMEEDSLILSHPSNIGSRARFFNTRSGEKNINFCSPNTQINRRGEDFAQGKEASYLYNEMVFKKKYKNKIKQPDYILVFRENGIINNIEQAIKSSHDFGKIPIVIIDKDKCAISELKKIKELVEKYNSSKDEEYLYQIKIKIQNNMVSNKYFKEHIDEIVNDLDLEIEQVSKNSTNNLLTSNAYITSNERDKICYEFEKIEEVYGQISRR